MLPASNRGVGMNIGFPDVCMTPPVGAPIPYPNLAMNATAVPFAVKTFLTFVNAVNMGSMMPITLGDQAGSMSPFMGPGRYTLGNPKVFLEGLPGINLLCPTTGNNMVNGLGAVLVPSITNVFFSHAGAAAAAGSSGPSVSAAVLSGLARALAPTPDEGAEAALPGGVAYVRIPVFSLDLPSRVHAALKRARARALILDLRGCPGGELTAAVELAGDFLGEGEIVATVLDADGDATVYRSRNERPHALPLALLVDRGTASAAEVFAGALQGHRRAVVIGERTLGKGTAQHVLAGHDAPGAHYATVATVTRPNGEPLDGNGIRPDVEIDDPPSPPAAADFASPEATAARLAIDPAIAIALGALRSAADG